MPDKTLPDSACGASRERSRREGRPSLRSDDARSPRLEPRADQAGRGERRLRARARHAAGAMTLDTAPTFPFARPPVPPKQTTPQARPPASRPPRQLSTAQFWALIGGLVVVSISAGWLWNEFRNRPRIAVPASTVVSKPRVSETERRAAQEAAQALLAVQSITRLGVSYRDYQPRLGDAKIKVDQYVARPGHDARVGTLLNQASGSHEQRHTPRARRGIE